MNAIATLIRAVPAWAAVMALVSTLHSESVTLTLDDTQSSVTATGSILGNAVKEQGPGSLTARIGGTLVVDLTASTIQFMSGSRLDPLTSGVWEPGPKGVAGSAPADFAGGASSFLIGNAKAALRNIELDVRSGPIPIQNGAFNAGDLVFSFPEGSSAVMDYATASLLGNIADSEPLAGLSTNKVTTAATLTEQAGQQVITIPVDATLGFTLLSPNDTTFTLKGQLVGRRNLGGGAPSVTIGIVGRQVVLRWPSAATGYSVQSSSDLLVWAPRAGTVGTQDGFTTWTADLGGGREYFRLVKP